MAWSSRGTCRLSKAFARCASCVARQKRMWKLLCRGIQTLEHLGTIKTNQTNDAKFHREFGKAPVLCTFVDQLAIEMAYELFHDFAYIYIYKCQQAPAARLPQNPAQLLVETKTTSWLEVKIGQNSRNLCCVCACVCLCLSERKVSNGCCCNRAVWLASYTRRC